MNAEVAKTNSVHRWSPEAWEITMMDCYCLHRGVEAVANTYRTWLRLSFEVRIFDRLGNAHNPAFRYSWYAVLYYSHYVFPIPVMMTNSVLLPLCFVIRPMVPRDIEGLNLVPYEDMEASLRVFPWQSTDGSTHTDRSIKTKPNLNPSTTTTTPPVAATA
jgi:hypothetical protein